MPGGLGRLEAELVGTAEAEAHVVPGIAEDEDERLAALVGGGESRAGQRASDALALALGRDRERRELEQLAGRIRPGRRS